MKFFRIVAAAALVMASLSFVSPQTAYAEIHPIAGPKPDCEYSIGDDGTLYMDCGNYHCFFTNDGTCIAVNNGERVNAA